MRLEAQGPYIGGDKQLPKVDIDLKIGAAEAGQTVNSGFLSTGDRAFVKFGGEFYEQPKADVARANRELAKGGGNDRGSLRRAGPQSARMGDRRQGRGRRGGRRRGDRAREREARRAQPVRGPQQAGRALRRAPSAARPRARPIRSRPPTSTQLADVVENPTFDIYVGKEDDVIRRVSGNLSVKVPEKDRAQVNGISGGTLRFSVELAKVNGDQVVEAPGEVAPDRRPDRAAAGAGALGALGGSGATRRARRPPTRAPPRRRRGRRAARAGGDGVETSRSTRSAWTRRGPDDTEALARCAELLR